MKKTILALTIVPMLTSCKGVREFTKLQPDKVEYYKQSEKLMGLEDAGSWTIKSPTVKTTMPDGSIREEPVMRKVVTETPIYDEEGEKIGVETKTVTGPVSFKLHFKDTAAKPPMTGYDVLMTTADKLLFGVLGYKGFSVLGDIKSNVVGDPFVVQTPNPLVVTQNPSGSVSVN